MPSTLKDSDIMITLTATFDDAEVEGNAMSSGDDAMDKEVEDEINDRLKFGDVWAWALVKVTARYPGLPLEGVAYLGACSYASEEDFRKDGYFADMVAEATEELKAEADKARLILCGR